MSQDAQFDAALNAARERSARTGRSSYIWTILDGPGGEPRHIVTGADDTVAVEGQQQVTLAGLVSGTGHNSRPRCWHGLCTLPGRDADEGIQTTRTESREKVSAFWADREPEEYDEHDPRL